MSIENVVNAIDIAVHKLPYMISLYKQSKDEADKMQHTRQHLLHHIESLNYETAFSIGQQRKVQKYKRLLVKG
jgi:hypothetical protein